MKYSFKRILKSQAYGVVYTCLVVKLFVVLVPFPKTEEVYYYI